MRARVPLVGALAAAALACAAPARAAAQEVHAGARGWVFETTVLARTGDGTVRLADGAALLATPDLAAARPGEPAVLVPLRSGWRIWTARTGLVRGSLAAEPAADARTTDAVLVWVERVADGGATVVLTGGSVFRVGTAQREFVAVWGAGEALLIGDARLLHLDHGAEIVDVTRVR